MGFQSRNTLDALPSRWSLNTKIPKPNIQCDWFLLVYILQTILLTPGGHTDNKPAESICLPLAPRYRVDFLCHDLLAAMGRWWLGHNSWFSFGQVRGASGIYSYMYSIVGKDHGKKKHGPPGRQWLRCEDPRDLKITAKQVASNQNHTGFGGRFGWRVA